MRPDDCLDQDCDEVRERERYRRERDEAREFGEYLAGALEECTACTSESPLPLNSVCGIRNERDAARTALADARTAYEQLLRRYAITAYPGRAEVADNWVRNCRELAAMAAALAGGE